MYGELLTNYIASGTDDWDDGSSTNTTIVAIDNQAIFPAINQKAYMRFAVNKELFEHHPNAVVEEITFHWYVHNYSYSRRHPSPYVILQILAPFGTYGSYKTITNIYVPSGTGWKSVSLGRDADRYAMRDDYMQFRWYVPPVRGSYLNYYIRAYEYSLSQYRGYVEIYYHLPQDKKRRLKRIWSKR